MRVQRLRVKGFRGIKEANVVLDHHSAIVGPNGCGKSAIVDALSLALGRARMVRSLTEHDFFGSRPSPADRISIVATLTGFATSDPARLPDWFRAGRGVPKWIDKRGTLHASPVPEASLAVEIGFAARFDHEELIVESVRYFHDGDCDPFDDAFPIESVPSSLIAELGLYVLPVRRGWEGAASFASELFRRIVSNTAGIPAAEILAQRDLVRDPPVPIETSPAFAPLVKALNERLAALLPDSPQFKLRLTAGDTEAVLQALLPHYTSEGITLPASRHGAGLLSMQTLLLLLEVGAARKRAGLNFILAMEEPELHLAPGLQGRLVADAIALADQTMCTTHSPRVALRYEPTQVLVVRRIEGTMTAEPMLKEPLANNATNDERRLFHQNRARFTEALLHPYVLVPEGRFDGEWLARLVHFAESEQTLAPFSTIYGVAPTENAAVKWTAGVVRRLRPGAIGLVDGDAPGDGYVRDLTTAPSAVDAVIQWPRGWFIEHVIGWIVEAGGDAVIAAIDRALDSAWNIQSPADLVRLLTTKNESRGPVRGLKEDLVAHDAIASCFDAACLRRAGTVLDALVACALGTAHPNAVTEVAGPPTHYRFKS